MLLGAPTHLRSPYFGPEVPTFSMAAHHIQLSWLWLLMSDCLRCCLCFALGFDRFQGHRSIFAPVHVPCGVLVFFPAAVLPCFACSVLFSLSPPVCVLFPFVLPFQVVYHEKKYHEKSHYFFMKKDFEKLFSHEKIS